MYTPHFEHESCGIGLIATLRKTPSHQIVRDSLTILRNLMHRGSSGVQQDNGDGGGLMIQIPDKFFQKKLKIPPLGQYAVGMFFLPQDPIQANECEKCFEAAAAHFGLEVIKWREVPVNSNHTGLKSKASLPRIRQAVVVGFDPSCTPLDKERLLFLIRQKTEKKVKNNDFYIVSLSCKTVVYKGMLTALQLERFYQDFDDPDFESAAALVHTRFSTNTFPSWPLAHPYRLVCHNGEINTLRGNVNWILARVKEAKWDYLPQIDESMSDSAIFDAVLESLVLMGVPLVQAIMMMIPDAWDKDPFLDPDLKAFYEYHSCLLEPWDGPACMAFFDGDLIGACLDRNGLRPARYLVTKDDRVIMASETGVLDIAPENILMKGRLKPASILVIDTKLGKLYKDIETKTEFAKKHPFRKWLDESLISLKYLQQVPFDEKIEGVLQKEIAFGYTQEEMRLYLEPLSKGKGDPVSSMGNDAALACLSNRPRLLFDYFKQLFAQVTNPPLDAIREEIVTQMSLHLGPRGDLFPPGSHACRMIRIESPLLSPGDFAKLEAIGKERFQLTELSLLFPLEKSLKEAVDDLVKKSVCQVQSGAKILVLSDFGTSLERLAIPSLLALSAVQNALVESGLRTGCSLIVKTAEARQVHHFCLLLGYGAAAVYPYLACSFFEDCKPYLKGAEKGILKVISKLGISTIQSYLGSQCFEAVGLNQELIEDYFSHTASRIEGVGIEIIEKELRLRHDRAYFNRDSSEPSLDIGGDLFWKRGGEYHLFNPETVYKLQHSTKTGQFHIFQQYTDLVDKQNRDLATIRGLLEFRYAATPIPLDEVESEREILRRFTTSGMSYGAISSEAQETLSIAMHNLGARSNSGEGGEDPDRYKTLPGGIKRYSNVHQVASARFGVNSLYLVNCEALQIKMAQGAKPGEGGQLPGGKVYPWIAKVRHSTPGVELISPPPHHDIYSIEDLAQLIFDLKNSNPEAEIQVKLVSEAGVGTIAAGVCKARADAVLISGHDGGTGAAPITSLLHSGTPWEIGLAETQQTLVLNNLRSRIAVEVDGQLKTGKDVVVAALLGADRFGFGTAPLVVSGCIMMRVCHLNTCPVGVATQDPVLRKNFTGQPRFVENFFLFIARQVREEMAKLGFRTMDEMIGQVDRLKFKRDPDHWKAKSLDLSALLHKPEFAEFESLSWTKSQTHEIEKTLDFEAIIPQCKEAIENKSAVDLHFHICNYHRSVGTQTGYLITKRWQTELLAENLITCRFTGSAGQSFGAFIPSGLTLVLEGDANDYVGKGLSGGKIVLFPPKQSTFVQEENVIAGNVCLYGATSGKAFFCGTVGDRFAVRNSGAHSVVEGVGDHGCEYMTEGCVVVLGLTRRNFAAGMTGGVAFVLDERGDFNTRCNLEHVDMEPLDFGDAAFVKELVEEHTRLTSSQKGEKILKEWESFCPLFVKVIPREYKRVRRMIEEAGENWQETIMDKIHG